MAKIRYDVPAKLEPSQLKALERAAQGLQCDTAVHICYGYGIKANIDWKKTLGGEWRQYEEIFPALAKSRVGQVSVECINSRVPLKLLSLLEGKDVLIGVIDVASDEIETPEQVADTIGRALQFVPRHRLFPCTNCGMVPLAREVARGKLEALGAGAAIIHLHARDPKDGRPTPDPKVFMQFLPRIKAETDAVVQGRRGRPTALDDATPMLARCSSMPRTSGARVPRHSISHTSPQGGSTAFTRSG